MNGDFGLMVLAAVVIFWITVLYILGQILRSLRNIDQSVSDVAKSLRNQKLNS
jgi:ABC-type nitrate/sulfonate/bicarbonate transport system permease component